jgi:hypothetical protein
MARKSKSVIMNHKPVSAANSIQSKRRPRARKRLAYVSDPGIVWDSSFDEVRSESSARDLPTDVPVLALTLIPMNSMAQIEGDKNLETKPSSEFPTVIVI